MKRIGVLGGLSWESSIEYYRILNEITQQTLGGSHSADVLLYSFDFSVIEKLQERGDWKTLEDMLADAAHQLKRSGVDFLVIASNTIHKVANNIEHRVGLPILHIADATAAEIARQGLTAVGLLGTKFTMEEDFYKHRVSSQAGLTVITPRKMQRDLVHAIIYSELVRGIIRERSKEQMQKVMLDLVSRGAEGVILGCTEIGLLIKAADASVPIFDTTYIHARDAVAKALGQ